MRETQPFNHTQLMFSLLYCRHSLIPIGTWLIWIIYLNFNRLHG